MFGKLIKQIDEDAYDSKSEKDLSEIKIIS